MKLICYWLPQSSGINQALKSFQQPKTLLFVTQLAHISPGSDFKLFVPMKGKSQAEFLLY